MQASVTPLKFFLTPPMKINLIALAGLFGSLILLSGCQTVSTPEQVTQAFWEAMTEGDIEAARKWASEETQNLVAKQQNLEDAEVGTGAIVIDGPKARVATVLSLKKPENGRVLSFDTVLAKENNQWKVDYRQTLNNYNLPLGELFKSLQAIGESINKELEQQIPLFEKQLKSFGEELQRQMEEFRRELEKSLPADKEDTPPGTI